MRVVRVARVNSPAAPKSPGWEGADHGRLNSAKARVFPGTGREEGPGKGTEGVHLTVLRKMGCEISAGLGSTEATAV